MRRGVLLAGVVAAVVARGVALIGGRDGGSVASGGTGGAGAKDRMTSRHGGRPGRAKVTRSELEKALRETLEDRKLSRSERRALGALLSEAVGTGDAKAAADTRAWVRSRAFDLARGAHTWDSQAQAVLGWLEDVNKLLAAPAAASSGGSPGAAAHSKVLFSPRDDCAGEIVRVLGRARRTVDICVFTITDNRVADAVLKAAKRGVKVRVITDDMKSGDRGSDIERMEAAGVPVRMDRSQAHMHNKFAVLDGRTALTGSYNWTRSAARDNQENLVVTDDPALARAYAAEFARLWAAFE